METNLFYTLFGNKELMEKYPMFKGDRLSQELFIKTLNYIETQHKVKSCYSGTRVVGLHLLIDFEHLQYKIPKTYIEKMQVCLKDDNVELLIIPILLVYEDSPAQQYSHYNVVIINKNNRKIEYFEPGGEQSEFIRTHHFMVNIKYHVEKALYSIFGSSLYKRKYKFIDIQQGCPIGLQKKQIEQDPIKTGGLCVAWCLLCIHLRILNPKEELTTITTSLLENKNIDKIIRKYIQKMHNTLHLSYETDFVHKCIKLTQMEKKKTQEQLRITDEQLNNKINELYIQHIC
jgi:hypothetical protein